MKPPNRLHRSPGLTLIFSQLLAMLVTAAAVFATAPLQPQDAPTAPQYLYGSVADPTCSNATPHCGAEAVPSSVDPTLMLRITTSIDDYWRQTFIAHHANYTSPAIVWYVGAVEPVTTGCGVASAESAFYCAKDRSIYLDSSLMSQAPFSGDGDIAVAAGIAHEWTHHVQNLLGMHRSLSPTTSTEFYPEYLELQADCGAGAWAQSMTSQHYMDAWDAPLAIEFFGSIGDATSTPLAVNAHGIQSQRIAAFEAGLSGGDGPTDCNLPLS